MKQTSKLTTGILSAAMLTQITGTAMPVPARAETAYTIQASTADVYQYEFDTFTLLHHVKKNIWYEKDYGTIVSRTPAEQHMTASDNSSLSVTLHFDTQTAESVRDGHITDRTDRFRGQFFSPLSRFRPMYTNKTDYDRATQQVRLVPEPSSYPLTFLCDETFHSSSPGSLGCTVLFGQHECGRCGIYTELPLFTTGGSLGDPQPEMTGTLSPENILPYTSAGDANLDQSVDVADAVLISRYMAGDSKANMTDLGRALADLNNDDSVDSSDVNDVLYHVAAVAYENRVPAGTVPVIHTAQYGIEAGEAVFGTEMFTYDFAQRTRMIPGEDTDTWYFARWDADYENGIGDWNLTDLMLSPRGTLAIRADYTNDCTQDSFSMLAVTVPHGALPAETEAFWFMNRREDMPPYVPDVRYIPLAPDNEDGIQILSTECPADTVDPETLAAMAQTFGYDSADSLYEAAENTAEPLNLSVCTPGEEADTWDFAVLDIDWLGHPEWRNVVIRSLTLQKDGVLRIDARSCRPDQQETVYTKKRMVWLRVTVPHGTLPETLPVRWEIEDFVGRPQPQDTLCEIGIIPAEDPEGIFCFSLLTSGLSTPEERFITPEIQQQLDETDNWYLLYCNCRPVQDNQLPQHEQGSIRYMELFIRTPASDAGGFYSEYAVKHAEIEGDVLNLTIAEYRPLPQADVPAHDNLLTIYVPNNAIDHVSRVQIDRECYYDSICEMTADGEEQPVSGAVRGTDGKWHWEEETMLKDDFLAALCSPGYLFGDAPFYIVGDVPKPYRQGTAKISVRVLNAETGEEVPGCIVDLDHITSTGSGEEHETLHLTLPVQDYEIPMKNSQYGAETGHTLTMLYATAPEGYCAPEACGSYLPEPDGDTLEITLYTRPM